MATKLQAAKKLYKALVGKRSSQTSVAGVLNDLEQNFFAEPKMRLLLHIPAGDLTGMTSEVFDMSEEGEPFKLHKVVIIWRGTLTATGSVRAKINEDTVWHVSCSGAGSTSKVGKW